MSRYSLRATPRKKELFEGMVETPSKTRNRRSLLLETADLDQDLSSSTGSLDTAVGRKTRPRRGSAASSLRSPTTPTTPMTPLTPSTRRRTRNQILAKEDDLHDTSESDATTATTTTSSTTATTTATAMSLRQTATTTARRVKDKAQNVADAAAGAVDTIAELSSPLSPATTERLMAVDGYVPGRDPRIDYSNEFEFGGSLGALGMMVGFPTLMWYMWIGATYYDGHFPLPADGQSWLDFGHHLACLVYEGAYPTARAFKMYWAFFLFEVFCYVALPGVWAYGKPLLHEGGRQLKYWCSGYVSLYVTMVVMGALHYTGAFKLYTIIDELGPLMTVSIISGYAVSLFVYITAHLRGRTHRMTGYPIYDFFMGAELNPRVGIFDLKMFLEVRFDWYVLLLLAAGAAARQYETYGYVSLEVWFVVLAQFLYANACSKGEELIVTTWDIYFEKGGFMYIFWTMSGVPFSYCHHILYLARNDPETYHWNRYAMAGLYVTYLFVYWVWDSCNSQKNRFRAAEKGKLVLRNTFPQLPWQTVHNPKTLTTPDGHTILVDGWYGLARKIHYTADVFFAISWGLVCGVRSPFPWFYPVFFTAMIIHRASRDIHKCRVKYGETWREYERQVPYLFIPYII